MGRPPAWNPISALDGGAWLETVEFATGDRLILPIEVRRRLGWKRSDNVTTLLAILSDEGALELMEWEPKGRVELQRVGAVLGEMQDSDRHEILLAAMDRYSRAAMARDGRLRLSPALVAHLGASASSLVRIAATGGRVWLWPEPLWEAARQRRFQRLDDAISRRPTLSGQSLMPIAARARETSEAATLRAVIPQAAL